MPHKMKPIIHALMVIMIGCPLMTHAIPRKKKKNQPPVDCYYFCDKKIAHKTQRSHYTGHIRNLLIHYLRYTSENDEIKPSVLKTVNTITQKALQDEYKYLEKAEENFLETENFLQAISLKKNINKQQAQCYFCSGHHKGRKGCFCLKQSCTRVFFNIVKIIDDENDADLFEYIKQFFTKVNDHEENKVTESLKITKTITINTFEKLLEKSSLKCCFPGEKSTISSNDSESEKETE